MVIENDIFIFILGMYCLYIFQMVFKYFQFNFCLLLVVVVLYKLIIFFVF